MISFGKCLTLGFHVETLFTVFCIFYFFGGGGGGERVWFCLVFVFEEDIV